MPYSKTNWVNNSTPLNATNLNKVEQGISDAEPHRGSAAPPSPVDGKLWEDTNTSPATLKAWNGSSWETVGAGGGSGVTTSDLASTSDAAKGDALVGFNQNFITGSAARTVHGKLQDFVSVTDFGADPTGSADSSAAFQAAADYGTGAGNAVWGAGMIFVPRGRYKFNSTVTLTKPVHFFGSVQWPFNASIRKGADVTLFEAHGTFGGARVTRCVFSGLCFEGAQDGSGATWTQPLMLFENTSEFKFYNCMWMQNAGSAIVAQNAWDHYHTDCFFQDVGGSDGTKPAVRLDPSPDAAPDTAGNSTNNQYFTNCRFETSTTSNPRDGWVWQNYGGLNRFVNLKMEDHGYLLGPSIKISNASYTFFTNFQITSTGPLTGETTPYDMVQIDNSIMTGFVNGLFYASNFGSGEVRSVFRLGGGTTFTSFKNLGIGLGNASFPSAVFSFTGTNTQFHHDTIEISNPAAVTMPIYSGTPTSVANSAVIPTIAGTVSDASFKRPPTDGEIAIDANTNTFNFRSGGTWRTIASGATSVSSDRTTALNSANITLTATDAVEQRIDSTLTRNASFTLPTGAAGMRFRFVKTGIGNFTLGIGTLFTFPQTTRGLVEVVHNGTSWIISDQEFFGVTVRDAYTKPYAAIAQTIPRESIAAVTPTPASGTLYLNQINLPAGVTVTNGHVLGGTGGITNGTGPNFWIALYSWDGTTATLLQQSTNDTAPVWGANNVLITKAFASTISTTYTGTYYFGLMVSSGTGGTNPQLATAINVVNVNTANVMTNPTAMTGGTGLTTTAPTTATLSQAAGLRFYAYVS